MSWRLRAVEVVRLCLQLKAPENELAPEIANADVITELNAVSRRMAAGFPCIGNSSGADALTGDDALFWGEGVGYLFCAGVRRILPKKAPTGEPLMIKLGNNQFEFAAPPASLNSQSLEEVWGETAWQSLRYVSCIAQGLAASRAVNLFQAAGRRSALEAQGRFTTFNPLFNVMQDMLRVEAIFIQNEAAWALWDFR